MNQRLVIVILLLLAATLGLTQPASAQTAAPLAGGVVNSGGQQVIVVQPAGFAENALASCAGGAAIGYLVVVVTGGVTPVGTAALFCGLSVAATTASAVTAWTWHTATSFIY